MRENLFDDPAFALNLTPLTPLQPPGVRKSETPKSNTVLSFDNSLHPYTSLHLRNNVAEIRTVIQAAKFEALSYSRSVKVGPTECESRMVAYIQSVSKGREKNFSFAEFCSALFEYAKQIRLENLRHKKIAV